MNCYYALSAFLVVLALFHCSKAELFTAVAELEKLLDTEKEIITILENYLRTEEERLQKIKWLTNRYMKEHEAAIMGVESYLTNPLNAFLLMKRLTTDWESAFRLFDNSDTQAAINSMLYKGLIFPTAEDLTGSAAALIRLQEVYLMDTETIARGYVKGNAPASELTAGDTFELGKQAYNIRNFKAALLWMEECLRKLKKENAEKPIENEILEYMGFSAYVLKNYTYASELTERLIELDPHHPRAHGNLFYYRNLAAAEEAKKYAKGRSMNVGEKFVTPPPIIFVEDELDPQITKSYEKLCRGESIKAPIEESQLHCYFTNNNNSYLFLQPVRVEVLNKEPRIVMFHNVFSDKEAAVVKSLAIPKLTRATVNNSTTGETQFASYRISKSAWLQDYEHKLIPRLNKRIEDITGLDAENAEPLHVINYGIGGHYDPHFDFAKPGDKVSQFDEVGNRIATWIAYLSDVPAGGSTVFPKIGVEVKPVKGSAAFWYNLHKNGTGDENTMHAACPVLAGSKWVSNSWLHEFGNEFKRPCSLHSSH